ncbi:DUF742 domain-containing protein [Actinocatenispora comari]|jgi:hypothetical protein|uniref:DUF742 domain-containing protein n=1 Tax=Actinocatenispora comari TaxID=2807577 RepID=A0A8J4EJ12_9ACTN|nr:DUF742 domain-containing protein [Actinocatenispora comari]GIL25540.1 hypothetical protein NUM_07950 [Actinocatenispora comari]
MANDEEWVDEDAGRVGRLYALTGGRVSPTHRQLDVATQFKVAAADLDLRALEPEQRQIAALCQRWLSMAEVSAFLHIPLVVARQLLSDLVDHGVVTMSSAKAGPSRAVLLEVLHGLKAM